VDTKKPWLTYAKWAAAYGLVFIRLLGQEIAVVINSQHVAEALMDKRSRIYSDKPCIATVDLTGMFGWSLIFAFAGYGDEWRLFRRLFHQTFRPGSALKFRPTQIEQALIINLICVVLHHYCTISTNGH
ncbi:uncharacterized protein F5147DRAFT_794052, partial [Suillus discolor]